MKFNYEEIVEISGDIESLFGAIETLAKIAEWKSKENLSPLVEYNINNIMTDLGNRAIARVKDVESGLKYYLLEED